MCETERQVCPLKQLKESIVLCRKSAENLLKLLQVIHVSSLVKPYLLLLYRKTTTNLCSQKSNMLWSHRKTHKKLNAFSNYCKTPRSLSSPRLKNLPQQQPDQVSESLVRLRDLISFSSVLLLHLFNTPLYRLHTISITSIVVMTKWVLSTTNVLYYVTAAVLVPEFNTTV